VFQEYALSLELQISKEEQLEQQRLWDQAKLNYEQQDRDDGNNQARPQKKCSQKERKKSEGGCSVM